MDPASIAIVVTARGAQQACLPAFLAAWPTRPAAVDALLWVWDREPGDDDSVAAMRAELAAWAGQAGTGPATTADTVAAAVSAARAGWLFVCTLDQPPSATALGRLAARVQTAPEAAVAVVVDAAAPAAPAATPAVAAAALQRFAQGAPRLLRGTALAAAAAATGATGDTDAAILQPQLAADVLAWRVLQQPGALVAFTGHAGATAGAAAAAEPPVAVWRRPSRYDGELLQALVQPVQDAAARGGVPLWLQVAVLEHLHWYYTVDARQRAPTVACAGDAAERLHQHVQTLMHHIQPQVLAALPDAVGVEVRHALWSYRAPTWHSAVAADAFDHDLGLLRLSWWVHGTPAGEAFLLDGRAVEPAYAKYRGCHYYGRLLLRQRIVWLAVPASGVLQVQLGGVAVAIGIGPQGFALASGSEPAAPRTGLQRSLQVAEARASHPHGKGGQLPLPAGRKGWSVRLLKAVARLPWPRARYRSAWVFIDREEDADDSAEHLYRWVRQHHPHINCWFMLLPGTADWTRLQAEGFRLMAPGLRRKLLLLNSRHIISSHTDYVFGGFDRRLYGDAMHWRYTFLQHGVIKDDLTHWLGPREFDRFITSSPQEHASIVGDDTGYPYTEREVRRTGLPRHDRLLRMADALRPDQVRTLLVMPTWRASLVDERVTAPDEAGRLAAFAQSAYAAHWRALLNSPVLAERAAAAGVRIAFMPHANAAPFLQAFQVPSHVSVVTSAGAGVQAAFASSVALVTDYTSVAFTMALLRRQVFYYQFDRDTFYRGGHNWREGYFDYERDGFGPVSLTAEQIIGNLSAFLDGGCRNAPAYEARMVAAMPDRDDQACQRVFDSILEFDSAAPPVRLG